MVSSILQTERNPQEVSSVSSSLLKGREEDEIKTMPLYNHVDRVFSELRELGIDSDATLDPLTLSSIDSLHYLGNEAIENAIQEAGINKDSLVLDVGSGLGGPARMLAHWTKCHVDTLELQRDLNDTARLLTSRCGSDLSSRVYHQHADFMKIPMSPRKYDAVVSWLVFLHIENHRDLLQRAHDALKPGGVLYVEDFFRKNDFTAEEKLLLKRDVYVSALPTREQYVETMERAGLEVVKFEDVTARWTDYVCQRFEAYKKNIKRHERVNGYDAVKGLSQFYSSMEKLFTGGNLGGVIYVAKRKS
jgi:cyclopropane fatty-acyl-phospholipid synthase-like methyltransferase